MFGQMAAMNMQMMVRALLVYRLTGSAEAIGIMAIGGTVPHIFSSLYGGVIADRMEKKYVLLISLGGFFALSLSIALTLSTGWLNADTWWILVIAQVVQSIVMGLLMPARHAIIPALVGKERLMNAVSLNALGQNGWRLIAPAAAGFLVEGAGFGVTYFVISGLFLWAIIFTFFLPLTGKMVAAGRSAIAEVVEGFKYLRREPDITWVLVFNLFAVVLAMPYQQLLPVFVDDILKVDGLAVGAGGLGLLVSISGAGAMVGSTILASLPDKKRGLTLLTSTMFLGLVLTAFSFSSSWPLSLGIMVFIGMGQTGRMALSNTLAQHYSSDKFRGRVMGIFDMQMSFPGFAVYGAGLLTGLIGVQWAVGSIAMTLAVISLVIMVISPRLRQLD